MHHPVSSPFGVIGGEAHVALTEFVASPECTLEAVLDHPELLKELRKDGETDNSGPTGGLPTTARELLLSAAIRGDDMGLTGHGSGESQIYTSPVVDFLSRKENLLKMVKYISEENPAMWEDEELKEKMQNGSPTPPEDPVESVTADVSETLLPSEVKSPQREVSPSKRGQPEPYNIFDHIRFITLTDFAPLPKDSLCVNIRDHYHDQNYPGENAWCRLTLDPPQETDSTVYHKEIYKYPYIIHEVLTESCKRLIQAVSEDEEVLLALFNLFSRRMPLNPVLLGYTSSTISTLMSKHRLDEFFAKHEDRVLEDLFFHLENRSVAEILKMLIFEERGKVSDPKTLIHRLFDCMDLSQWPCDVLIGERQENVFLIIRELIHAGENKSCPWHNVYMHEILSSEIPDMLMECVFHWHKSTVTAAIGILVELLMYLDPNPEEEDVMIQQIDSYGHVTYDDRDDSNVVTDFSSTNLTDAIEGLELPYDHRVDSLSSDGDDLSRTTCGLSQLTIDPPLYPLEPWDSRFEFDDEYTSAYSLPYDIIANDAWNAVYLSRKEEPILGGNDERPIEVPYEHLADDAGVAQYPAPPKPYQNSGQLFDQRLRKYVGRLLTDLLEPLTSAAAAHRDRRRNKTKDTRGRGGRHRSGIDDDEEEFEIDQDFDPSMSPTNGTPCGQGGTFNGATWLMHEPAVESCEPMREDLYNALYPDPSDPEAPILDPYFTLDWYQNCGRLPACDPHHNALQHIIDVIPPEYQFSEYQSGRKVAFGLVQNAFQNGIRPVVGHRLLEILHLFRAFIRVQGSTTFHLYITKILKCVHSLLFAHKWNSILHISLGDIIIYAIQRGPVAWPEAVDRFITESGFFHQASKFMRRYVRYKKELHPEPRRVRRMKLHSGALPIVLEILRIFQELSKCSPALLLLIRDSCNDWDTFSPLIEDLNLDGGEWAVDGQMEGQ